MAFDFEIKNHGQARTVTPPIFAPLSWDGYAQGCESSPRNAGEDALERFWERVDKERLTVADGERLERAISRLPDDTLDEPEEGWGFFITICWRY